MPAALLELLCQAVEGLLNAAAEVLGAVVDADHALNRTTGAAWGCILVIVKVTSVPSSTAVRS